MNKQRRLDLMRRLAEHLSPRRLEHSRQVAETAAELAVRYGLSAEPAWLAGILHDCARELSPKEMLTAARQAELSWGVEEEWEPVLLHAPLAAQWAKSRYGVDDADVLQAIALHTTGAPQMRLLDKILYLADLIEPDRDFVGVVELRELAETDIDRALLKALDGSIVHLLRRGALLHPSTVTARNWLLQEMRQHKKEC